jgi:sugar lactone lactonase YvrE
MPKAKGMIGRCTAPLVLAGLLAGCAPIATQDASSVKGAPPHYGPSALNGMPNGSAIAQRIWVPDLDLGFDPQGIAVVGGELLVSGYRSLSRTEHSGSCWLVRIDIRSGKTSGRLAIPSPCRHAGGVAVASDGTIYVADTNSLFLIHADSAFSAAPHVRRIPLTGFNGAFATVGAGRLWIGTYDDRNPGRLFGFDRGAIRALAEGQALDPKRARRALTIPPNAQGAALDPDGKRLWIARSGISSGALDELDLATGKLLRSHDGAAAIDGIAFDRSGLLWAVSESGVRHFYGNIFLQAVLPFHPLLFQLRPAALH